MGKKARRHRGISRDGLDGSTIEAYLFTDVWGKILHPDATMDFQQPARELSVSEK